MPRNFDRKFRRPILAKTDYVVSITKACVALLSFFMADRKSNWHYPDNFVDIDFLGKSKPVH